RRHTRVSRDWSSDVCSSDLVLAVVLVFAAEQQLMLQAAELQFAAQFELADAVVPGGFALAKAPRQGAVVARQGLVFRGIAGQFEIGRASCRERARAAGRDGA